MSLLEKQSFIGGLIEYGSDHGYDLLTTVNEYQNSTSKLTWKDKTDRIFTIYQYDLKNNGFPKNIDDYIKRSEAQYKTKLTIWNDLQQIAEKRGGKLISTVEEYTNNRTDLRFIDAGGQHFQSTADKIKRGHWSPYEGSVSEHLCRQTLEHIFGVQFPPTWKIINSTKKGKLQLDGYNDNVLIGDISYKIAFEYQGHQNHRIDNETIKRDSDKKQKCDELGIVLIVVDLFDKNKISSSNYIYHTILSTLPEFIRIQIKSKSDEFILDFEKINHNIIKIENLKKIGEQYGIRLITEIYTDRNQNLQWERIRDGYLFTRNARNIWKRGFTKLQMG